jgi:DNA-binding Lrp family transcriptional regulator
MADLDELDTAILRELQADARRTNRDIAAAVGVAPTTALDRTRGLRERGIIRGALLDIDLTAIGRPVQALISIRIRPPKRQVLEAFRDWASQLPQTLGLFVVTGHEDFLLHVAVADNQDLYTFVIDHLTQRPEVADVRTSVVYEHIRNPRVDPAPLHRRARPGDEARRGRSGKPWHDLLRHAFRPSTVILCLSVYSGYVKEHQCPWSGGSHAGHEACCQRC